MDKSQKYNQKSSSVDSEEYFASCNVIEEPDERSRINSEWDADIPDINQRLAYLKPSRQLLEFYRKRFAQQDAEQEHLVKELEDYKERCDQQYNVEFGLRQREEEIFELQRALSDIQLSLFQEREQVLRLYAENDRYKIQDLSSRRVIQKLLEDGQPNKETNAESVADRKKNPATLSRVSKAQSYSLVVETSSHEELSKTARKGLMDQIESLQAKLELQTRDFKESIEAKIQERQQLTEEYDNVREKDFDKLKTMVEKLHKTHELLFMSTQDILTLRKQSKAQTRQWMIQKDKILRELDMVKEQLNVDQPNETRKVVLNVSTHKDSTERQKRELQKLKEELASALNMQELYREQVVNLEDEVARVREQEDLKYDDFNEKVDKTQKRYNLLKERFKDLEKRRNLEVEGFKTDIKALRKRLKEMQQQLFKVTLGRTDSYLDDSKPDDLDLAVLNNIRKTAASSKRINTGLKRMKLKIHKMESALSK